MSRGTWADKAWLLDPVECSRSIGLSFNVCKYCGGRVDPPKRYWCSSRCVFTWGLFVCWNTMRRFVWLRAGKRCEMCNRVTTLHENTSKKPVTAIHHIIQVSDGGTDEPSNLMCLCSDCHKMVHSNSKVDK